MYGDEFDEFFGIYGDEVYVWGLNTPPGHIYFAQEDKAPAAIRARVERRQSGEEEGSCSFCLPIPPLVRVPMPVVV